MSERPTLYLDTLGAVQGARRRGEIPEGGTIVGAMVAPNPLFLSARTVYRPRRRRIAAAIPMTCPSLHPDRNDLGRARAGQITGEEYHRRVAKLLAGRQLADRTLPRLSPGTLECCEAAAYHAPGRHRKAGRVLAAGDVLVCMCARPGSPKRPLGHHCHLEEAAYWLVMAGWDVVLYGRRLTMSAEHQVVQDGSAGMAIYGGPVSAEQRAFFVEHFLELSAAKAVRDRLPDCGRYPLGAPQWRKATDYSEVR